MRQQTLLERFIEWLSMRIARRLPKPILRHALIEISERHHKNYPEKGILDMTVDDMWEEVM